MAKYILLLMIQNMGQLICKNTHNCLGIKQIQIHTSKKMWDF